MKKYMVLFLISAFNFRERFAPSARIEYGASGGKDSSASNASYWSIKSVIS